jgi:mRNA-degrading endonuclease RelE of RelBE toxin-antitoxin system
MTVVYAAEFERQFRKLPAEIQDDFRKQEARFRANWRDPRLHVKKLVDHPFTFSFRVTRRYRVLFALVDSETALFATIGHRREVYRR